MSGKDKKKPSEKSDDWFWKMLAVVGTLASIAGLVITIVK